jgi:Cys-tRNA(Pro) deacylase
MAKEKLPITPAVRVLRAEKVAFTDHPYAYEEKGGTTVSARELGVDEHCVIKTLVMEDEAKNPLLVLMHGDMQVSTKELARRIGVKQVTPCTPETAQKHTGYLVGGTSPFGTRRTMPVYMEETVAGLERVYINGGKRGYLVAMAPAELIRVLKPLPVMVGISDTKVQSI